MGLFGSLGNVYKSVSGYGLGKNAVDTLFGNSDRKAMPYLEQINQLGKDTYQPYIQQGQEAYGQLQPLYQQMANNPNEFLNQLLGNYQQSKGYQAKRDEALQAARNSAAAGGFAGTSYDQGEQAKLVNALLDQDMQQYLQNVLGIQGQGMGGYQDIYNKGYGASGAYADYLGSNLGQQAGLAFQSQRQKQQTLMDLLGMGAKAAGTYFGKGA